MNLSASEVHELLSEGKSVQDFGRTTTPEQAGKGAAEIWASFKVSPERAPAESPYEKLSWYK